MSYRYDGVELARIGIPMMASAIVLVAGLLGSLPAKGDTLPNVSDGSHVMRPTPIRFIATPLNPDEWAGPGPTPFATSDSIGATNVKYLTAARTGSVDGPRARLHGPR